MKKILIVEDSKVVNNIVANELKLLGYSCTQVYNFISAVEILNKNKYDLIILDLHLPDGEGYELIHNIQSLSDTKVVILTGNTEKQLREELFHHGILDYIIKDKNLSYAIQELHKILAHIEDVKTHNILVIDDSTFICKQIESILLPRNYKVTIAKTGKDGLEKLVNGRFDLVTLDMELPDIHGSDVLEEIKSHKEFIDLPVIVISGTNDSDLIRKIYKKGGSDFIRKPFIVEEFALKVDLWTDYRKKHYEEIEQKDLLLSQQSKMATMGEMLENIIHQSKQPLSLITSLASGTLMKQEFNQLTTEYLEKNLEQIIQSALHLSETMTMFRNFYKKNSFKTTFDLSELFMKAFQLTESKFHNRGIATITNFEDIKVYGFDIELLQVFINILNNARDEFGRKQIEKKYIFITTYLQDNFVYISIKDNAGGIPEDIIEKVFDSHFTTKSEDEGTGIGLYMSKEIIEKHHEGEIFCVNENYSYEDVIYRGANFIIKIPLN
ncbi:MAG: hybrid sensor histidine kinase/response regulator [Arcobacteraceae bacterium]|nr:hybrid sensor histidine kinase/response regulator [Arcobacteraceae bacterium]